MEAKELESSRENSRLHERINELLRSHAELNDSIKQMSALPAPAAISTPSKPRDASATSTRIAGNAFDTTRCLHFSSQIGCFDESFIFLNFIYLFTHFPTLFVPFFSALELGLTNSQPWRATSLHPAETTICQVILPKQPSRMPFR